MDDLEMDIDGRAAMTIGKHKKTATYGHARGNLHAKQALPDVVARRTT